MENFVRIPKLRIQVEAELLDSMLNLSGIPHALISWSDSAFDGLFQADKGWGAMDVPAEREHEALELLASLRTPSGGDSQASPGDD